MSAHTPGPWKTRKGLYSDTIEIFAPNPKIEKPFKPTALAVVEADTPEGKANARLMAAAPLMLEALKCAIEFLPQEATIMHQMAQAAIAKATA